MCLKDVEDVGVGGESIFFVGFIIYRIGVMIDMDRKQTFLVVFQWKEWSKLRMCSLLEHVFVLFFGGEEHFLFLQLFCSSCVVLVVSWRELCFDQYKQFEVERFLR